MNPNYLPALREILELQRELAPMLDRFESLKATVREFGPGEYPVENLGKVKISSPSIAAPKGTEIRVNAEKFSNLPPTKQAALLKDGVLDMVTVYSRAAASSVKVEPLPA